MATPIGRPVSPTYTPATPPAARVTPPASSTPALETSKPVQTQASFAAARQSVVGNSSETVNPSQGGPQVKQGIDQVEPCQLLEQGQGLMESPVVKAEFSDGASTLPKLPPPTPPSSLPPPPPPPKISSVPPQSGGGSITPDMLVQAREKLKPISQHQVLNLEKGDTIVTESSRSVVLKDEGSAFAPERLGAKSTLEIVGHGGSKLIRDTASQAMKKVPTVGGQDAAQLARTLKHQGITHLAVLDLKSCDSAQFKSELSQELVKVGITVGEIRTYEGDIAISRATGKVLTGPGVEELTGHDGMLGMTDINSLAPAKDLPELINIVKQYAASEKILTPTVGNNLDSLTQIMKAYSAPIASALKAMRSESYCVENQIRYSRFTVIPPEILAPPPTNKELLECLNRLGTADRSLHNRPAAMS